MMGNMFHDIAKNVIKHFGECPLGKLANGNKLDGVGNNTNSFNDLSKTDISDKEFDDFGNKLRNENGDLPSNSVFMIDGKVHLTDDKGNVYCINEKLMPNSTYELNGNIYKTDHLGRIVEVESHPKLGSDIPRNIDAQRKVGGEDRRPNDQGGHIVGNNLGGDSGLGNLIPMDQRINQSDYKNMENDITKALEEGKDVTVVTKLSYPGDSNRPDKITSTVTIDGKDTVYKFDNNMDGSLMNDVPENGKDAVQDKLNETGGTISSIKEQYDDNGNLVDTTVYITYTDENGKTYKTGVVVENQKGSEA